MNTTLLFLSVLGMGMITYGIRVALFLLPEHVQIAPWLLRMLRYVPSAVLSAIIFPEVLQPGGAFDLSLGNERLIAAVVAAMVAWRTRNVLLTVGCGMLTLWLLQALGL